MAEPLLLQGLGRVESEHTRYLVAYLCMGTGFPPSAGMEGGLVRSVFSVSFFLPSNYLSSCYSENHLTAERDGRTHCVCVCVSIHAQGQVKVFVTSSFSLLSFFDSATPSFSTELSLPPPNDCCNCSCVCIVGTGGEKGGVAWRAHLIHLFCFTPADCWGPYQFIVVGSQLRVTAPFFVVVLPLVCTCVCTGACIQNHLK